LILFAGCSWAPHWLHRDIRFIHLGFLFMMFQGTGLGEVAGGERGRGEL